MSMPAPIVAQVGLSAPRVAVVFNGGDAWHYWARLAIHAASRLWGGRGFLLVPNVDGVVAPAILRAAQTYAPDRVRLPQTPAVKVESAEPGALPLKVEGGGRTRLVAQIADQYFDDSVGEQARQAVAEACSPYR